MRRQLARLKLRSGAWTPASPNKGKYGKKKRWSRRKGSGVPISSPKKPVSRAKPLSNAGLRRGKRRPAILRRRARTLTGASIALASSMELARAGPSSLGVLRAHWQVRSGSRRRSWSVRTIDGASRNAVSTTLELIDHAVTRAKELKECVGDSLQDRDMPITQQALPVMRSPSESVELDAPPSAEKPPAPVRNPGGGGGRSPIAASQLELAIAEAVKNAAPSCQAFVGVIVQRKNPKTRFEPNWALRGIKFGKADRAVVEQALEAIVERMQREFTLSDG
jgi:hypothetical protein